MHVFVSMYRYVHVCTGTHVHICVCTFAGSGSLRCWVADYCLLAMYWLLTTDYWLLVADFWLLAAGCRLLAAVVDVAAGSWTNSGIHTTNEIPNKCNLCYN